MIHHKLIPVLVVPLIAITSPVAAQDTHTTGVQVSDSDTASADLFVTDVSVLDGQTCIGNGCVVAETFDDDDVLKLKAANNNILFEDSSSTNFPSNDWRLLINEDQGLGAGGINRFSIEDVDAGTIPFTIRDGAPENAFYVDSSGRIGLGTILPERKIHIVDSFTPGITLEQTDAGKRWDINGNHESFRITEVGTGTAFRIRSPSVLDTLVIQNGNVGINTFAPSEALHVKRYDNTASILVEDSGAGTLGQMTLRNNGITYFTLEDTSIAAGDYTGRAWNFQNHAGTFRVTTAPAGAELLMTATGDLTISGTLTTAGSCSVGCDRVFDAQYSLPSIAAHNAEMWANGYLPNVGPTAEGAPFNVSDKMGRMLNELEHAHIFIGQQQDQIKAQDDKIEAQDGRIATLEAKLEMLLSK